MTNYHFEAQLQKQSTYYYLFCIGELILVCYQQFLHVIFQILCHLVIAPLREKGPNTEFFLVRIWTLFTQCTSHDDLEGWRLKYE